MSAAVDDLRNQSLLWIKNMDKLQDNALVISLAIEVKQRPTNPDSFNKHDGGHNHQ